MDKKTTNTTPKKRNRKLDSYATKAFKLLENENYQERIQQLEACHAYEYALLNIWNKIEQSLKLFRYYDHINDDFPKILDSKIFNRKWSVLKKIDEKLYNHILKEKGKDSLHAIRNNIVHYNETIDEQTYQKYKQHAEDFLKDLKIPTQEEFKQKKNGIKGKQEKTTKEKKRKTMK